MALPPNKYPAPAGSPYPFVGENYRQYGDVAGYVYNPYDDEYYLNANDYQSYLQQTGQAPKKPTLAQQVLPIAAGAGAMALGSGLVSNPSGTIQGIANIPGMIADKVSSGYNALTSLGSGAGASAAPAAAAAAAPAAQTSIAGALPIDQAANDAFNAGANAAQPGFMQGWGGTALGAAGLGLGAYNALQGIKKGNELQAGLGGLGAAAGFNALAGSSLGAGLGLTALGPVGWAAMAALPVAASFLGGLGDKDQFKTEGDRLSKLREQGVFVPQGMEAERLTKGRSKEELIALERSRGEAGNVKFAESRNEADLRPVDIVGYAAFAEQDPTWFQKPLEERLAIADQYLKAGAVREAKGSIYLDPSKLQTQATGVPKK